MLARVRPSTASTYLTAVKSMFKWLESVRAYPNVAADIKTVKLVGNIHRKDALTPAQAKRVLQVLKGDTLQAKRDFALVNLLIRVGLRSVEDTRGRLGDLRNRGDQTILLVQGKGRVEKDALVVLTDATLGPIYDYLAARRCEEREVVGGGDSPLFASLSNKTYGKPLSTRSIRQIAKEALRAAGLDSERLTTHSFRHSAVTFALLGGASLQQAQALARHTNLTTTMVYAHNVDRVSQAPERFVDGLLDD